MVSVTATGYSVAEALRGRGEKPRHCRDSHGEFHSQRLLEVSEMNKQLQVAGQNREKENKDWSARGSRWM